MNEAQYIKATAELARLDAELEATLAELEAFQRTLLQGNGTLSDDSPE